MAYYLEKWNIEKNKWDVLYKSKNKINLDAYVVDPNLKNNDTLVTTKSYLRIFKKVLTHCTYYNTRFNVLKKKIDKGVEYRNAARQHYYFIRFWTLYNKTPKIVFKIAQISVFPTIVALIIYLYLQNLSLTISIWAALVSMFTVILINPKSYNNRF